MIQILFSSLAAFVWFQSSPVMAFETCTVDNNYLESVLPQPQAPTVPALLPQKCVEAAHLSLPVSGYYGYCPTSRGRPVRGSKRPCVSEKYVSEVHTTLIDVADCLDYDPRLAFANFNLESAMHLNAVGAATDAGVGQLTKSAIDEVNLNAFDRALRMMRASPKASCQRLLPYMTKAGAGIDERCALISLPENPARNLIYSILLLQQNRRVINNLWTRLQINLPPAVDVERLKTLMQMLAYNSGPAGITSTLKAYSTQMGSVLTDQHFSFEGLREDSFTRYLKLNFPSTDGVTRKRVSKYVGYIMASARRADRLAGGTQECLHTGYFYPPVRPSTSGYAPDHAQAQHLVTKNMIKLAKDLVREVRATNAACSQSRTEFEYMFLAQGQKIQELPTELQEIHRSLCP